MTELSLLEKLRLAHVTTGQRMLGEAAERIEALEAALKPFAELGDKFSDSEVLEHIRQASKALGEKQ
jgi:hypothetical protein